MKQKRNYSLTAKERKQKRAAEENNVSWRRERSGAAKTDTQASVQTEEAKFVAAQKRSKRSALIVGCVVALAVLLIVAALIVPIIMYVINPYRGYGDVIARFRLSNGMTLEYVIDEDEYDTAATNFIFLATNKYFDNTVFYDAQGGWLRFGGFEAQPRDGALSDYSRSSHRSASEQYCKNFKALPNNRFNKVTDKFGYRLRADTDGTSENVIKQLGALTFLYNTTSTEFQFFYGDNGETVPNDIAQLKCTMVGHALNEQTINNIIEISSHAQLNPNIGGSSTYLWRPPTPDIKIDSVDVYNLDGSKWNKFNFINYISGNDSSGSRRYTSWQVNA